ncbi:alpha-hydroxy-acid oxidizing protein [Desulfopila aestuarii]|uniref:FMN-dependent dehydrogenase, includes L-lactate dehydrogenase and type II isopentenyl diphosphate isomerase n=1 Tax=Desulfopila aestuarii DSM 18488 TaxID=1121416 RepID=A0A1M7Y332_9BACT|nr:alpha-hydroxy-acid oxidizing protein [Desulfopila aestuarii]SHO46253.1 FMN-dependent dehydrogenase, includes L-lactate dehydrogenase and type II isopentenyl diphosphate isomerase [Desulfopila aestuarii DSM 18488]
MKDVLDNARKLMKGYCRVCPVCDGRACAGEVPGMGGLGTASAFKANLEALGARRFNMRLVHEVKEPDTATTLLGKTLSMPVLAAPIGGVSFNMGGKVSEEEYIHSIVHGCLAKGTLGCTGDGVPDFIHQSGFDAIRAAGGLGIPFVKPWEDQELFDKLEKAQATGADIIGMDIDAAGLVTLRKMGRPVSPKSVAELKKIRAAVSGKFILKGVMTVEDALLAAEAGVDAIVVSNHGGRVLDFAPGAAEVLPKIASAVKGKMAILADGGVRSGGDVLKLLALGADAVMIGRPFSMAAVGGLKEGVELYLDKIMVELTQCMVLTGTESVAAVDPGILL